MTAALMAAKWRDGILPNLLNFEHLYAVRICGDFLAGEGIASGDVLIVNPDTEPLGTDLAVVWVDGQRTVGRYGRQGDTAILEGVIVMGLIGGGIWTRGGVLVPWEDADWSGT